MYTLIYFAANSIYNGFESASVVDISLVGNCVCYSYTLRLLDKAHIRGY